MKKLKTILVLTTALVLGMTSCTDKDETTSSTTDTSVDTSSTSEKTVSRVSVTNVQSGQILQVGDTLNLQDYVTITYTDNTTSHTAFAATVRTTETASLGTDGFTLTIIKAGSIRVEITSSLDNTKSANFVATAYEEGIRELNSLFTEGEGLNHYAISDADVEEDTGKITYEMEDTIIRITDSYTVYPNFYDEDNVRQTTLQNYELYVKELNNGKSYMGTMSTDFSTITYSEQFLWSSYIFGTAPSNIALYLENKTVDYKYYTKDTSGNLTGETEDKTITLLSITGTNASNWLRYTELTSYYNWCDVYYTYLSITKDSSDNVNGALFGVYIVVNNNVTENEQTNYGYYEGMLLWGGYKFIHSFGTANIEEVDNTLTDPSYVPEDIDTQALETKVATIAETKNYTIQATSLIGNTTTKEAITDTTAIETWNQNGFFNINETIYMTSDTFYDSYTYLSSNTVYDTDTNYVFGLTNYNDKVYKIAQSKDGTKTTAEVSGATDIWTYNRTDTYTNGSLTAVGMIYMDSLNSSDVFANTIFTKYNASTNRWTGSSGQFGYLFSRLALISGAPFYNYGYDDGNRLGQLLSFNVTVSEDQVKFTMYVTNSYLPFGDDLSGQAYFLDIIVKEVGTTTAPDLTAWTSQIS